MDLIYDILKKLKNYEIRHIRNLLKASPFEYEKVGKLFELVTRYKDKDEEFFSQKLYGAAPNNTFRVTKSRLKRILEDEVLNDKSLTDYSAVYINALLQSKKRVLQGEILLGRGAYLASKNLLLQVIASAKKFSQHNERFLAELLLHRNQSINVSVKEFQKRSEQLLRLNEINHLVNEAAILHYSITNILTIQTLNEDEELAAIQSRVDRIRVISEQTESPLAQYYYLLSQILFLQYSFRFADALEYCKMQLKLVQKEPSVHSKQRLGSAYFQLTETSLRMGDFVQARKYVEDTLKYFSRDETNYLIVLETAFQIAFMSGDWTEGLRLVKDATTHPRFSVSKMRAAKWNYFNSCLLFKTGKIREAMLELNNATALLTDRHGWNLSFRLLEIMILHEAGHFDLLESKILNLKQFVRRTHKNSELYRPMILISTLMEWQKNSMELKKAAPAMLKKLKNLEEHHETVPFNPIAGELIRIENWLKEKIKVARGEK